MREGDEETRRQMRVLHEEVIGRIATLGESLSPEGTAGPPAPLVVAPFHRLPKARRYLPGASVLVLLLDPPSSGSACRLDAEQLGAGGCGLAPAFSDALPGANQWGTLRDSTRRRDRTRAPVNQ
jgi:hypothetical protein